jgi:hypothetical protein
LCIGLPLGWILGFLKSSMNLVSVVYPSIPQKKVLIEPMENIQFPIRYAPPLRTPGPFTEAGVTILPLATKKDVRKAFPKPTGFSIGWKIIRYLHYIAG